MHTSISVLCPLTLLFLNSLWFDRILLSFLQEIIDVVVIDFYVGDEDAVAGVLVHTICFISLLWLNHVCNFRIQLLSEIREVIFMLHLLHCSRTQVFHRI